MRKYYEFMEAQGLIDKVCLVPHSSEMVFQLLMVYFYMHLIVESRLLESVRRFTF